MEQLDVSDGFDVHEYRDGLKLLRQERETMHLDADPQKLTTKDMSVPTCST